MNILFCRDGTEELFSELHIPNVPVLVFSAGMGDILEQVLKHFNVYTNNVKVVSNFFKYDEEVVLKLFALWIFLKHGIIKYKYKFLII